MNDKIVVNDFSPKQNYPNPFNSESAIKYSIPFRCNVNIEVYDILGNKIKTLLNSYMPKGEYSNNFNAAEIVSGVYIYSIKTVNFVKSKK